MEISSRVYNYSDLKKGIVCNHDDFGIFSKCTPSMRETLLNNPNLIDDSHPFMYLSTVDDVAGGIAMWFPTKLKAGNDIGNAEAGTTLEVYEEYRKLAIGADITVYPITSGSFNFLIYAGISEMALKLYKKLKFQIFEYPRAMRLLNSRPIIESIGLHGLLLKLSSFIINIGLKIYNTVIDLFCPSYKSFRIEKLTSVPQWVDDIVLNDGHKYMEVHDYRWLQWNLDYNFYHKKGDLQSFYAVKQGDKPVAFFMTKERFRALAGGKLKNIITGSIMEWGISKESSLTEADLYTMAIKTFSKSVDIIEFATDDINTLRIMKRRGFLPHGYAHIAIKDLKKKYKDSEDMNLWRIRFGYTDVFLT